MPKLAIQHRTSYRYRHEVLLSPHHLMLRPRESRELRLVSHEISISPKADLTWATDVFGNAIATASFALPTKSLVVDSLATVNLSAAQWPVFAIATTAINYPFVYSERERIDLGALAVNQYPDQAGQLRAWAKGFIAGDPTDTLSLLKDLSAGVSKATVYQSREEEGTQSPLSTLNRGLGSCRDIAVLFVEAARSLCFGARVVSGYLYNPNGLLTGSHDAGSTHAWAEIFLPGAGWITFDPTNRSMGGANLIPVAVTRDIVESVPVSGSFVGPLGAFIAMDVAVQVKELQDVTPGGTIGEAKPMLGANTSRA